LSYGGVGDTIADWDCARKSLNFYEKGFVAFFTITKHSCMQSYIQFIDKAMALRRQGRTYSEIQELLTVKVPPSTLSTWFKQLQLSHQEKDLISFHGKERIRNGSIKASATRKLAKKKRLEIIYKENLYLKEALDDNEVAKITLVMLYLCEGSKHQSASLCFGNSNPGIIHLFLQLLRQCYKIDEKKLRCTVQCRADQDTEVLISFWSRITLIPINQFYRSRIDKRSVGVPTKKPDYKGVCRIDYFSAALYNELKIVGELLSEGL